MLELLHIYKNYMIDGKPFTVLKDINLAFEDNGFVSILGPSGCGKTTLLNIIGGLDHYTSGDLIINGKTTKKFIAKDWDAYRNKRIGFVFQSYNLIPHLTILENVQLSLVLTGVSKKERIAKTTEVLKKVGLFDQIHKKPNQLSGGQMQRVAIARALINDPDIILADEPTGALDSETSIQVMDILSEISKNKLVIMVTHNENIANKYSNRIIKLLDGRVIDDSKHTPLAISSDSGLQVEVNKKTHMSFWTALVISMKSIWTKKGRTILTSVAASFGIIGVALVLALQNGFTNYVNGIETQTASSLPISVQPYTTTLFQSNSDKDKTEYPSDGKVHVYDPNDNTQILHRNYFTSEYVDYVEKLKTDSLASSILYNHDGLDFNVLTKKGNNDDLIIKLNQYKNASSTSGTISSVTSLPGSIFHELYGDQSYMESLYDVIDGKYPQNANEVVLVVNRYNEVNVNTLYNLGIIESSEPGDYPETISFQDIYNHEYRAYTSDTYMGTPKTQTSVDTYEVDTTATLLQIAIKGENFTADDIVRKEANRTVSKYYCKDSSNYVSKDNKGELNKLYYDETLKANEDYVPLHIVGVLRSKEDTYINLMPASIGYNSSLKDFFAEKSKNSEVSTNFKNNWYIPRTEEAWDNFIQVLKDIQAGTVTADSKNIYSILDSVFTCESIFTNKDTTPSTETYIEQGYRLGVEFPVNEDIVTGNYKNLTTKQLTQLFTNINSDLINYIVYYMGYSTLTSIVIFPVSLTTKSEILKKLDAYNKDKTDAEQILYLDVAGTVTGNIGTMIQVISSVLIVFASISLVVSCVMTGIITYASVLERTKEIGILRAIGARKLDVGVMFEAESMIVGFASGLIGIIVSYILCIPVNIVLNNIYYDANLGMIANLNPLAALILIAISILLTFISGFIPSRLASNKDPVEALRTE
jgi:putative ABC transport system permease protein